MSSRVLRGLIAMFAAILVADAGMPSAAAASGVVNSITLTNRSGVAQLNYPLQFGRPFVDGAVEGEPVVLINGVAAASQADVKNRYPDGSVEFAVIAVVVPALPASGSLTLTFQDRAPGSHTPLSSAQMLDPSYDFNAMMMLKSTSTGVGKTVSARTMLANGDYQLWTAGPVAQTIILGDDSTARKYDIGFDGYHPFRPRFYATFWPATHQVAVRYVGENDNVQEVEDLSYNLTLIAGNLIGYGKTGLTQWAMTNWSRSFWLGNGANGGTPSPQIDIDYNLGYLEATRWLPGYDTSIKPTSALVAGEYALWTGRPHDLYDGQWDGGLWQNAMGTTGERQEIGPYPTWDVLWLYTGDWRMRQMALGLDDLAAAWPANLRETDPARRLQRTDPAGLSPETGLGHTVSITDRRSTEFFDAGYIFTQGLAADRPVQVGPFSLHNPWTFDGAHQPQPWFVPYVLTGDPWYLDEAYLWAGFSASRYPGGVTKAAYGRGPTGAEGVIADELRGAGWVLRSRVETALMAPDSDPEKAYFTTLTNDALARWEGGLGVMGTPFDGSAVKLWGAKYGDYYSTEDGTSPEHGLPPPLGNWESNGSPPTKANPVISQNEAPGIFVPGAVGTITSPWMQYYLIYGLGRAKEVGFAAEPLLAHTAAWLTGLVNNSGYPTLVAQYEMPVEKSGGGFFATWAAMIAALKPAWLTGNGYVSTDGGVSLPAYWAQNLNADGRQGWAIAAAGFLTGEPGGAQMWSWMQQHVYNAIGDWASNPGAGPKWAVLPRTDANALPAMPTVPPPPSPPPAPAPCNCAVGVTH